MEYDLGVVGLGHWFGWLKTGIGQGKSLDLKKAVGTKPYDDKKELLSGFGITEENYFISDADGSIPSKFYDGLDVVHISDPNRFHSLQIKEALEHRKHVITEKTLATSRQQFDELVSFVQENNYEDRLYLHLHYLHKQPTIALATLLPELIEKHGKLTEVKATFFEKENSEDSKRTWILGLENGGIFMDWIHSFEVIYYTTKCGFGELSGTNDLMVHPDYSTTNPTGIETTVSLSGNNYADGAYATIRAAKGVTSEYANKSIRFWFESGKYAMLCFPGHESEFNDRTSRGRLDVYDSNGVVSSETLSGPNSSEIFINEIIDFCEGEHRGLKISDISEIFGPQWEYQETAKSRSLIKDPAIVNEFLRQGISGMR